MHILFVFLQTINILLFGHSYGVDSSEYLPAIAREAGMNNVMVGRFVKGNCSLEEHYNYFVADTTGKYSECLPGQVKYRKVRKTVREAVSGTRWDYVIFQNSLENEGRYETAQPYLNKLIEFVRTTQKEKFGKEPVIGWNMFWPISKLHEDGHNKTLSYRLSFYENSSDKMWQAYVKATKELVKDTGIKFVIPTGTAVMNARLSSINTPGAQELTRDGYHMSYGAGRFLAASTFYEKILAPISGKHVIGNGFRTSRTPLPVQDDKMALVLQRCAAQAVKTPYKVRKVSEK